MTTRPSALRMVRALAGVALAAALAACAAGPGAPTAAPSLTPFATQVPAPTPRLATPASVVRVVDGDTIVVSIAGEEHRVRYIGMDAPESVAPGQPVEWLGPEAARANASLVEGRMVLLEKDVSDSDRYGRLLRYVYIDGVMVNAELVRLGCARAVRYPPDVRHQEYLKAAEQEAREARRGLWAEPPTAVAASTFGSCRLGCADRPPGCLIKGLVRSGGGRVYLLPGDEGYSEAELQPDRGDRWFCVEDEAVAAGWRRARQ